LPPGAHNAIILPEHWNLDSDQEVEVLVKMDFGAVKIQDVGVVHVSVLDEETEFWEGLL
jgi:hypothetical protein